MTTKQSETDELPEPQRVAVQLHQAERLTMGGHVRAKLALGRKRIAGIWGVESGPEDDDDMSQTLARDITNNHYHAADPAATQTKSKKSSTAKWIAAAAVSLGIGTPTTTAILMAPKIIAALNPPTLQQPAIDPQPQSEYAPILLPGRPKGVQR